MKAPKASYYDVAWPNEGTIAAAVLGNDPTYRIDVLSADDGQLLQSVPVQVRTRDDCPLRVFNGLSALDNRLTFGDTCSQGSYSDQVVSAFSYDPASGDLVDLGLLADRPLSMSWNQAGDKLVYTAGSDLCETTFERTTTSDGPINVNVTAQGSAFSIGENVPASAERCTERGNSRQAVFAPDDQTLAVFVSAGGGSNYGPARDDLPWAIAIVDGVSSKVILDGIVSPGGLAWQAEDKLIFSGSVSGTYGLWSVRSDGSGLIQIGTDAIVDFALSPDKKHLAGLVLNDGFTEDPVDLDVRVYLYDLGP
ncbi:MAG: hypothetical protein ACRD9W_07500 [Terriglobia bacterium]